MGRYNFVSGGAAAGKAIEQFLLQRALDDRQRQMDELNISNVRADNARADEQLNLQRDTSRLAAQDREAAQAQRVDEQNYRRAANYATTGVPGVIAADDADNLRKYGFGSLVTQAPGTEQSSAPGYDATEQVPGVLQFTGGSQYQGARLAEQARAEAAKAAQEAAAARQHDTDQNHAEIERARLEAAQGSHAVQDELTRVRIEGEKAKQEQAAKDRANAATAVGASRQKIRDLAKGLIDDPSLDSIAGAYDVLTPTFLPGSVDAKKRFEQLVNSLSVEERGKLKGQGAVSNFETQMLGSAVSALDLKAGSKNVRKHLQEILNAFQGDAPSQQTTGPAVGGRVYYDANGKPVQR